MKFLGAWRLNIYGFSKQQKHFQRCYLYLAIDWNKSQDHSRPTHKVFTSLRKVWQTTAAFPFPFACKSLKHIADSETNTHFLLGNQVLEVFVVNPLSSLERCFGFKQVANLHCYFRYLFMKILILHNCSWV